MQVRRGEVPILVFRNRLMRKGLALYLAFVGTGLAIPALLHGKLGAVVGLIAAIAVTAALYAYFPTKPSRCPACGQVAQFAPGWHWRYAPPYGFATVCRGCGIDLATAWDGQRGIR